MKIRVLLVDDEIDFLEALADRLSMRGFSIAKAINGEAALGIIRDHEIDVVILDMQMPGMDGVSTLREIKSIKPLVEVIMLTGHATIESAVEGMRAGAFDFLVKPADIDDLRGKILSAYEAEAEQRARIRDAIGKVEREKESVNERSQTDNLASIGELAAGIAHEINNPVAVMVGEAGWIEDLLQDEKLDFEEIRKSLRQISIQGERCKEITHKLLSFAQRTDPNLKEISVNEVISTILDSLTKRSSFENIKVETDLDSGMPSLYASAFELQQVFVNIINNAIDAIGGKSGTLFIRTSVEDGCIVIDFTDSGPGIPEAVMARMFEPFFTTKEVGKGTGLGLSICYGIVKKLGGNISVNSSAGLGSTFSVRLPLKKGDAR